MDLSVFITLFHIIGVALGVGGATVSDLLFFRALADKRISKDEYALLHTLGYILWAGLIILFLSGVGFVTYQLMVSGASTYLVSAWFWAKMTIIFALFCNALVMHMKVFPFMSAHLDVPLTWKNMHDKFVLLAITGTLSIISWYSAMILGVTRGFDFSYGLIVHTYVAVVLVGVLIAYLLFVIVLFPKKNGRVTRATARTQQRTLQPLVGVLLAVVVGSVLVITAWYGAKLVTKTGSDVNRTSTAADAVATHVVCVTESIPWFTPTVLQIDVGDTVIWDHCHDEFGYAAPLSAFASLGRLFGVTPVQAATAVWPAAYVHTHAIMSVSGPQTFSSEYTPVGHAAEGEGFMFTFTVPGEYEYISPTHPYMRGQILVGETTSSEFAWPPVVHNEYEATAPAVMGAGDIWVALQFFNSPTQLDPGEIVVVDASTWQVTNRLQSAVFHNPYQLTGVLTTNRLMNTQWHSDSVAVINPDTREVETSISVGNAPAQLVAHPSRPEVYVAIHNESRVAVLNDNGQWQRDIIVPFGPHGLALTNDGEFLAVASSLSGELAILSLSDDRIVQLLDMPGLPQEVVFTPDDNYAVVGSYALDYLRVVDVARGEVAVEIMLAGGLQGLTIDPDGQHLWVVNSTANVVQVIDIATWRVVANVPVAVSPHSIAFGQAATGGYYAYVTHRFASVLSVIDAASQVVAGTVFLGQAALGGAGLLVLDEATGGSLE